jgi:2-aminoadipate transaminase
MAKMVVAKQCVDVHTNMISQVLVYEYLTHYDLDEHVKLCCDHYRVKRDAMLRAIGQYFPESVSVTHPEGGLFLWATMPEGYSGMALHEKATAMGVAAVPGAPFFADNVKNDRGFRMNFSVPSLEQIDEGIRRMGQCLDAFIKK